jgi:hypothetical protein
MLMLEPMLVRMLAMMPGQMPEWMLDPMLARMPESTQVRMVATSCA